MSSQLGSRIEFTPLSDAIELANMVLPIVVCLEKLVRGAGWRWSVAGKGRCLEFVVKLLISQTR